MSLHLPSRRVAWSAAALTSSQSPLSFLIPSIQRRTIFWKPGSSADSRAKPISPLTEEYLRKKPTAPVLSRGGLASSSIFEDEEAAGAKPKELAIAEEGGRGSPSNLPRNPETMEASINPDPTSRQRWERKMVIRDITKRGRLTKAQTLRKEERVLHSRSHDFKISVKKLVHLAKQISGKTVEEAIVQMRFSKKKVAKDVKEHLEAARNEAMVARGMGLKLGVEKDFRPLEIITKDGKRVKVADPTTMYIDQAWCGKGLFQRSPDHRARGQINILKHRTTSLSVVLKEEKTRIRKHVERETKEQKRPVWVQLPNRPVTAQRQYYSW